VTTDPILLRITRLAVGRRASGFVQVAQCLVIGPKALTQRLSIGVLLQALSSDQFQPFSIIAAFHASNVEKTYS
jgi:hypothetical protein